MSVAEAASSIKAMDADSLIRIAVVDYRKGNLRSVERALTDAGYGAFITSDPEEIAAADGIVLPGVGSFADASDFMRQSGQTDAIRRRVFEGVPFLGICLGLQLMFEYGDEGAPEGELSEGLALLSGRCSKVCDVASDGRRVKVPHVGWNSVSLARGIAESDPLFAGVPDDSYFYFTHSYQCNPADPAYVTSTTTHAVEFVSSVRRGDAYGVQFHPEKSSDLGLRVLANFGGIVADATRNR